MKILVVASEAAPFIRTGGLADSVGALTRALAATGADVRLVIPWYSGLDKALSPHNPLGREPQRNPGL